MKEGVAASFRATSASTALQPSKRKVASCQVIILCIAIFLKGGLLGAYIPFSSLWLSKKGYSASDLGTVALVDASCSLLLPAIGGLFDMLRAHNLGFVLLLWILAGLKLAYLPAAHTFGLIIALTCLTAPLLRASNSILDSLALFAFPEKGDWTRVRLVGDIGFGVIAVGVGCALHFAHTEDAIYWIFGAICSSLALMWCIASPWMSCIREDSRQMSNAEFGAQLHRLRTEVLNCEVIRALMTLTLIGGCLGIVSTFEFVLLDGMMGSGILLGLCKFVGTLAAVPVWWFVQPVMDHIGLKNLQLGALACAGLRLFILGVIKNPWHALLSESLAGLGGWAAAYGSITVFVGRLVDEDMKGTAQTVITVVIAGIGAGSSPLLASYLVESRGIQPMFLAASGVVACALTLILLYDCCAWAWWRQERKSRAASESGKGAP